MNYMEVETKLSRIGIKHGNIARGLTPFKGVNFLTKNIVGRYTKGKIFFELSYDTGLSTDWIYGVTFATTKDGHLNDKSKCCHTFEEVEEVLTQVV